LLGIVKGTPQDRPGHLSLNDGKQIVQLPPGTGIVVNVTAINTHPDNWGQDVAEWRPSRWIRAGPGGVEELITPPKGVWIPWGDGARACPGKRFSQIEHLGLMSAIFRDHEVAPAAESGETWIQTKSRVESVIADAGVILNFQMWHPERVGLVWKRR
jgi:cytochrome P450